jgi:uncharacterized MAPEG superfamily protein
VTTPLLVLLLFAGWTLAVLALGVGIERWSRILGGRAQLKDFRADEPHGSDLYRRATRAHLNCIENLPVYGAIAVVAHLTGAGGPVMDALASTVLGARIAQTSVHVAFPLTNPAVAVRFAFFAIQFVCMVAMGLLALWP